ncbi:MAG: DUF4349 domain-containing protein [Thermoguttaceae bacterium]
MRYIGLLLIVGVLGCAGAQMVPAPSEAPSADQPPAAESLTGPAGNTTVAGREDDGDHPRRIIYTANVDVVVEVFEGVPGKVAQIAEKFGGYVASSNVYGQPGQPRRGTWTLRVPVQRYEALLAEARQLGELRSLTSNSQDVSEEYYDIEARIRNKQKTETRLVALLEEATANLEQILSVEQKLDQVREEIERMQGRLRVLADQTTLATVTVSVEQIAGYEPEKEATYGVRVSRAFRNSLRTLITTAADASIVVVAFSPWLAVVAALGLIAGLIAWIARRMRRPTRKPPAQSEPPVRAEAID